MNYEDVECDVEHLSLHSRYSVPPELGLNHDHILAMEYEVTKISLRCKV